MGNSSSGITISWTVNGRTRFDTRRMNETTFMIDDLRSRLTMNNDGTVSLRHPSNYTVKDHYITGTIYHVDLVPNNTNVPNDEPTHQTKRLHVTSAIENIHIVQT